MLDVDPYAALARLRPFAPLALTSADLTDGGPLPVTAWSSSRGGADRSPALSWGEPPEGTKSFAVSCLDPDAPTGSGYWHWAVCDIPADVRSLAAGAGDGEPGSLPAPALTLPNEARLPRFVGAAPPAGTGAHRYIFVVDALDVESLGLSGDETPAILGFNRHFHTLARGVLTGTADPSDR
ncbi:Raf kinase inhibitor-like YbhB/YbcL family protein [Microbacterium resistens]|uniref:Raf kinase inhibitor-like YbhB/YbcL family protein n=1 Tax=Microbacterium resistens TaxID=156977 RepID=A0ABU1SBP8_9MICO|nr:YbhB/YbcL family Raf kinase inhibitor-like protein [Microbacterium resistens]MDR6867055.1 Raf kinase inhibitor-like YbhB/YbcL family protein [Microbacterium resistens]